MLGFISLNQCQEEKQKQKAEDTKSRKHEINILNHTSKKNERKRKKAQDKQAHSKRQKILKQIVKIKHSPSRNIKQVRNLGNN